MRRFVVVVLLVGFLPALALASEPRAHDGGFYLRLAPGGGVLSTKFGDSLDKFKISGTAGHFEAALGAGVSRNLVLHATVSTWSAFEPKVELNGVEWGDLGDVTASVTMVGGGLTYYLGESNAFVSASAGVAWFSAEVDNETEESDPGLGLEAALGKEWWIGDKWAIGVAGVVNYHSVNVPDLDEKFKGTSFGIRVSFTMN